MKQIITMPIGEVKPYPNNPRVNRDAVEKVAASLQSFGWRQPIVVDKDYVIIAGHTRLEAAKHLKYKEVPILVADDLTEEQVRAYRLADNKTAEFSLWDLDKLDEELAEIADIDMTQFGFDFPELDEIGEAEEDDYEPDEEIEPRAKAGDLYQLGEHRLICGDSTDASVIDRLMGGEQADMVLSDPPYGMFLDTDFSTIKGSLKSIGRKNHTEGNKYDRVIGDNDDFSPELIETFFDNFGDCKEMFLFGADYYAELLQDKNNGSWLVWDKRKESQADAIGSEFELIWSKNKHKRRMLRHDWFGFLSSQDGDDARNRVHPTQKPVSLLADIIDQWGKDSEHIVDLYGGSGSTLIACEQLNRKCFMCELDPHYVDVIVNRWETFTGKKAVLLEGGVDDGKDGQTTERD